MSALYQGGEAPRGLKAPRPTEQHRQRSLDKEMRQGLLARSPPCRPLLLRDRWHLDEGAAGLGLERAVPARVSDAAEERRHGLPPAPLLQPAHQKGLDRELVPARDTSVTICMRHLCH